VLLKSVTKILGILLLVIFISALLIKERQRTAPQNAVNISFPIKNGSYFVSQSGPDVGVHQTPQEKYAMDIIKGLPFMSSFLKRNLTDYPIFGESIYAPCYGNVKELRDGFLDNRPGVRAKTANIIIIGCNGFDVYMAHIKNGSFKVKLGQVVRESDVLAEVGNSGNSSEPHLHIMAYSQDKDGNKIPLPLLFDGKYYLKWDSIVSH